MNNEKFLEIVEKYKNRPLPERKFDQFYATPETVIKRKDLILKYCDLYQIQKIIFFGDDDLTSIALALEKKFSKIIVLDIDDRILNFINEITQKENLKIETMNYDLRKPLPKNIFKDNISFAFFDPPYTPSAAKIWLIRALQILLGSGNNQKRKNIEFVEKKWIFMCYGYTNKSPERGLKIQKIITDLGLIIQEKFRKFNKYTGAETINNESDLYILQPTPMLKLNIVDKLKNKEFTEKIYTWEK